MKIAEIVFKAFASLAAAGLATIKFIGYIIELWPKAEAAA